MGANRFLQVQVQTLVMHVRGGIRRPHRCGPSNGGWNFTVCSVRRFPGGITSFGKEYVPAAARFFDEINLFLAK